MRKILLLTALALALSATSALAQTMFDPDVRPELAAHLERHTRLYYLFSARPFGIGIDVSFRDEAARDAVVAFLDQTESDDVEAVTGSHPFALVRNYANGNNGLRGGGASPGTAYRYLALKKEGAPADVLAAARRDLVRAIETLHVVTAITGIPGGMARGVYRLVPEDSDDPPIPNDSFPEPTPLFDDEGVPLPYEKSNGDHRADNSGGALPAGEWQWDDSCSKDQLVGWMLALATLYDAALDDPDIDQSLVRRMEEDAAATLGMLREKHTFTNLMGAAEDYDLIIMDADGRPTQHHDLNPYILEGVYSPQDQAVFNTFNLIMTLGIVKALVHVSGDEEGERFLYEELLGARDYLGMLAGTKGSGIDYTFNGTATNFSNVNMISMALFLAIYYENDPEVLAVYRDYMENHWWDVEGESRAVRHTLQPYFNAFYLAVSDRGSDSALVDETAALLLDWPLGPFLDLPVENCDADELDARSCVAIDGETNIEIAALTAWGDNPVATEALWPTIRPPSNFNSRSDPFQVNGGGGGLAMLPGGDMHAAYWMLRYLEPLPAGEAHVSLHARSHMPVGGEEPPPDPGAEPVPDTVTAIDTVADTVSGTDTVSVSDTASDPEPDPDSSGSGSCSVRADAGPAPALTAALFLVLLLAVRRWRNLGMKIY